MIKSKLFLLLKSLSQQELNRFGKYLNSPFFNESKTLIKLFKEYRKYHPDFENLTKHKAFKAACPEKEFNEVLLRNYNSDMLRLAENFLGQINLNRDNGFKIRLLNELNHRKLFSLFKVNYDNVMKALEKSPFRDSDFFYDKVKILAEKFQYDFRRRNVSEKIIDELEENFVNYTLSDLLIQCTTRENNRPLVNNKNEHILQKEIIEIVEKKKNIFSPTVVLNYYSLRMFLDNSEKYYHLLKYQVNRYGHTLDTLNHYNAYIKMISFNFRNKNLKERTKENFELTKKLIERNLIVRDGIISHAVYIEQVIDGLKLKKYKWVQNFIEDYKKWLLDELRDNVYNYCIGRYHYAAGNIKQALKHLSMISKNSYIHPLAVRNLLTRIYWEENDFDSLSSAIPSYKQYISKNRKLSESDIKNHLQFINIIEKMFKYKFDGKRFNTKHLEQEIINKDLPSKGWLQEKIEELGKIKFYGIADTSN